jgi:MinD superfamily P-loop ATPase
MTITVSGKFDITEIVEKSEEVSNCAVYIINEANLISSPLWNLSVSGKFDIIAIVENSEEATNCAVFFINEAN